MDLWFLAFLVIVLVGWIADRRHITALKQGDDKAALRASQVSKASVYAILVLGSAAAIWTAVRS